MHCGSFGNAANLGWSRLGFELPLVSRLAAAATTDQVCGGESVGKARRKQVFAVVIGLLGVF
jgi:hypothetical protein